MGGKGGEAFTPEAVEALSNELTGIAQTQLAQGLPALQQGGQLAQQLLQGNVQGFRGVINPQLEAARAVGSQQVRRTEEQAARLGLTGSALQEALASARFAAETGTAAIPAAPALSALQTGAAGTFALPGQAQQGLSLAGQLAGGGTQLTPERGGLAGGLGGALSGGVSGASAGATFGAPGAAIGGGLGALLGGLTGAK